MGTSIQFFLTIVIIEYLVFVFNSLKFGRVEPYIMHLENSGLGIMHMEFDLFIPDNLLYIDGHSLKTLNMSSMTGHLIAGLTKINGLKDGVGSEARFDHPYSFYQYNRSGQVDYLLPDNHDNRYNLCHGSSGQRLN